MNTIKTIFTASILTLACSTSAWASDITITDTWARASAGMARAGAAFMNITNDTGADDTLIAAEANISQKVELHTHIMDNGVMRMREVEGGIPVKAGETQNLKPGGYHVMFMGLNAPLKEGDTFPVKLAFQSGIEKNITVTVKAAGAMGMGTMMHGEGHMKHGEGYKAMHHGDGHNSMHQNCGDKGMKHNCGDKKSMMHDCSHKGMSQDCGRKNMGTMN